VLGFVVLITDCTDYRVPARAGAPLIDFALMLLSHPLLAAKKAMWKLNCYPMPLKTVHIERGIRAAVWSCTWIELISVRPEVQGKGLGARMLEYCATMTRTLGRDAVKLKVRKENARALKAYERAGFDITGEDADTYTYTRSLRGSGTAQDGHA
jgi:GNAT superfamily N-acetyltransferase